MLRGAELREDADFPELPQDGVPECRMDWDLLANVASRPTLMEKFMQRAYTVPDRVMKVVLVCALLGLPVLGVQVHQWAAQKISGAENMLQWAFPAAVWLAVFGTFALVLVALLQARPVVVEKKSGRRPNPFPGLVFAAIVPAVFAVVTVFMVLELRGRKASTSQDLAARPDGWKEILSGSKAPGSNSSREEFIKELLDDPELVAVLKEAFKEGGSGEAPGLHNGTSPVIMVVNVDDDELQKLLDQRPELLTEFDPAMIRDREFVAGQARPSSRLMTSDWSWMKDYAAAYALPEGSERDGAMGRAILIKEFSSTGTDDEGDDDFFNRLRLRYMLSKGEGNWEKPVDVEGRPPPQGAADDDSSPDLVIPSPGKDSEGSEPEEP